MKTTEIITKEWIKSILKGLLILLTTGTAIIFGMPVILALTTELSTKQIAMITFDSLAVIMIPLVTFLIIRDQRKRKITKNI